MVLEETSNHGTKNDTDLRDVSISRCRRVLYSALMRKVKSPLSDAAPSSALTEGRFFYERSSPDPSQRSTSYSPHLGVAVSSNRLKNRDAARKCREKKKKLMHNLQGENKSLHQTVRKLKSDLSVANNQLEHLKGLLATFHQPNGTLPNVP